MDPIKINLDDYVLFGGGAVFFESGERFPVLGALFERFEVHVFFRFVPFYDKSGAVGTEDGIRGVAEIAIRIITDFPDDRFGVEAFVVAAEAQ